MRIILAEATAVCSFALLACGGNAVSGGPTCGPGTSLVNGMCTLQDNGGGA